MNDSIKANQWLSTFRLDITSNSNCVYANGRQQVEVTVTLEPRSGEVISDAALDSLTLLQFDDDGTITTLDSALKLSSERDERFDYYGASGRVRRSADTLSSSTLRRRFYVSSKLPGGSLSTVHAGIWKDDDTHFETNIAPFKSSVVIESIAPVRLGEEHFNLSVEGELEIEDSRFHKAYFGFKTPTQRIIETRDYRTPSGTVFYERNVWDSVLISFTGTNDYNTIYRMTAYAMGEPFTLTQDGREITLNDRSHHMNLYWEYHRFYNQQHYNSVNESESVWGIIDQDGNRQIVEFFAEDGGEKIGFRVNKHKP
ncbi:hypothetical protein [Pseudomonas putida]